MKAKGYVAEFHANIAANTDRMEAAGRIVMGLMKEFVELGETRHCESDAAFLSLWLEIENKWRRICDMLPEEHFRPDGLWDFLKAAYPQIYDALRAEQVRQKHKLKPAR